MIIDKKVKLKRMQWNIENIFIDTITYFQMKQISALNNS